MYSFFFVSKQSYLPQGNVEEGGVGEGRNEEKINNHSLKNPAAVAELATKFQHLNMKSIVIDIFWCF